MTMDELKVNLVEEQLEQDFINIYSHAFWMARVITEIRDDPAFRKLNPNLREQIETISAAVE
jgi:hypothetical protein